VFHAFGSQHQPIQLQDVIFATQAVHRKHLLQLLLELLICTTLVLHIDPKKFLSRLIILFEELTRWEIPGWKMPQKANTHLPQVGTYTAPHNTTAAALCDTHKADVHPSPQPKPMPMDFILQPYLWLHKATSKSTTQQQGILCGWFGRLEQSTTEHSFGTYIINIQKHALDTSFLKFLLHWLTVSRVQAANIVWHPCSGSSHVTAPYKMSFYYHYYYYMQP